MRAGQVAGGGAFPRILHVVDSYFPAVVYGGPIRSVHALCASLVRLGADVTVATTDANRGEPLGVEAGRPVLVDGVRVVYHRAVVDGRAILSPGQIRHGSLGAGGYDLVHLHGVFSPSIAAGMAACRLRGIPYAVSPRGSLSPDLVTRRGALRKRAWLSLGVRALLGGAAFLHVTSSKEGEDLAALGIRARRTAEIPNGVDPELFEPPPAAAVEAFRERRGLSPGEGAVALLGRLHWVKGAELLVEALGLLRRRGASVPRLLLAGPDPEGYGETLLRAARRAGVEDRVVFCGAVAGEVRRSCLAAADVVALPSLSENFGLAAAEAMAAGRPVLVTPGVGIAPDVAASGAGVVAERTAEGIADALASLLSLPGPEREAMGARGRRLAAERYSWEAVAVEMVRQYEDAAGDRSRAR